MMNSSFSSSALAIAIPSSSVFTLIHPGAEKSFWRVTTIFVRLGSGLNFSDYMMCLRGIHEIFHVIGQVPWELVVFSDYMVFGYCCYE